MPTKKSKTLRTAKKSEPVPRKRTGSFISRKIQKKRKVKKEKTLRLLSKKFSRFTSQFTEVQKIVFLAVLGANLLIGGALYLSYKKTVLSFQVIPVISAETQLHTNIPTEVTIPSAQISVSIVETQITDGVWSIPPAQAGHLNASAFPGENSNMVLYAHNRRGLFANLHDVQRGHEVIVRTNRGQNFRYIVTEIMVVKPDEIDVVLPTQHEELTLYTCTGFFDSQRLVVKALPLFE